MLFLAVMVSLPLPRPREPEVVDGMADLVPGLM